MSHFPTFTPDELRRLATWPQSGPAAYVDARDYLRELLAALLPRTGPLLLDATIPFYRDKTPYFECVARLYIRRRLVTQAIGGGSTPWDARLNAELLALRKAVFGGRDVPVMGRLLSKGRLVLDMSFYRNDPSIQEDYMLTLRIDQRPLPWLPASKFSKEKYIMRAAMLPPAEGKRTRYMVVREVPAEVRALLAPYMHVGGTLFLHRVVMALDEWYINHNAEVNERLNLLGIKKQLESDLLEVHHLNAYGPDCRRENLNAIDPVECRGEESLA